MLGHLFNVSVHVNVSGAHEGTGGAMGRLSSERPGRRLYLHELLRDPLKKSELERRTLMCFEMLGVHMIFDQVD